MKVNPITQNYYKSFNSNMINKEQETSHVSSVAPSGGQNPSFKAWIYPSGHYSDWFVNFVKASMDEGKTIQDFYLHNISSYELYSSSEFGYMYPKKADITTKKQDYINLEMDLKNEQLNLESKKLEKEKEEIQRELDYEKKLLLLIEDSLKPALLYPIQLDREREIVSVPNCVMFFGSDKKTLSRLVEWTSWNVNASFATVKHLENQDPNITLSQIGQALESAEQNYQHNGQRTVLYVDGYDRLLNHKETPDDVIEALKDVMSCSAEDYHTTLIFTTNDTSKLDKIALQPHRVSKTVEVNFERAKINTTEPLVKKHYYERRIDKEPYKYSSMNNYKAIHKLQ